MTDHAPTQHGPECGCTRCRGFQPGHDLSLRHGAYSTVALGPRVDELVAELREVVPGFRPADEITVRLLAVTLARAERAVAALETADERELNHLARLEQDLRGWVTRAESLGHKLGLNPTARARLGVDVAVARRAETLTALAADAAREEIES